MRQSTAQRYRQMAQAAAAGATQAAVGRRFGVSQAVVSVACRAFGHEFAPPPPNPPPDDRPAWAVPDAMTLRECRLAREEAARHPDYKFKPEHY
jgi:hypothetical protein